MAAQQPLIYVENNVGLKFCNAFNEFSKDHGWGAQFQNYIHPGMQRAQHGDVWWIEQIAGIGYALLTCDTAIVENEAEREAVIKTGLRYVGFASGEYDGWTQMRAVTTHWMRLAQELEQPGPVIIKLYVGQGLEVERP